MTADEFNRKYYDYAAADLVAARSDCSIANDLLEDGERAVVVNFGDSYSIMLVEAAEIACATVGATVEEQE